MVRGDPGRSRMPSSASAQEPAAPTLLRRSPGRTAARVDAGQRRPADATVPSADRSIGGRWASRVCGSGHSGPSHTGHDRRPRATRRLAVINSSRQRQGARMPATPACRCSQPFADRAVGPQRDAAGLIRQTCSEWVFVSMRRSGVDNAATGRIGGFRLSAAEEELHAQRPAGPLSPPTSHLARPPAPASDTVRAALRRHVMTPGSGRVRKTYRVYACFVGRRGGNLSEIFSTHKLHGDCAGSSFSDREPSRAAQAGGSEEVAQQRRHRGRLFHVQVVGAR